ncbi:toll/interleukin-1 receptor domain-containing protein [Thauera sinica]|uniref:Toll/interleukin-1 receptor domain-containing protein n=1 Tax=Thauera sinica TaxID=2665146 RepID=A0ABW1AXY2_9RHOO|nr:toll/interleukin-1 receptor domain-containing protein [Thauera sp. K11]ATE58632.1 transcriptional regulator [Thauera sp. K11]
MSTDLAPTGAAALRRLAQVSILFAVASLLATAVALMRLPHAVGAGQGIVVAAGMLVGALAFAFGVMISLRKPRARRMGFAVVAAAFAAAVLFGLLAAVVPESSAAFGAWTLVLLGYAAFATHRLVRWPAAVRDEPKSDLRIFISYRRDDSRETVGRIHDHLRGDFEGENLFLDVDRQAAGEDYRVVIGRALEHADAVLVVIGTRWLTLAGRDGRRRLDDEGDMVRIEIETALARRLRVIPVLVQGTAMPGENDLPPPLRPLSFLTALPVRPDPDFRPDMRRLVAALLGEDGNEEDREAEAVAGTA